MKVAGAVVALIAGVFGCIAAVVTLFFGGVATAFSASGASTVLGLGWGGLAFSFLVIVLGACVFATQSRIPGWLIVLSAIAGAILGGTLVAICMVLALVGGILAIFGVARRVSNPYVSLNTPAGGAPSNAFCSSCGQQIQAGTVFCSSCGAKQTSVPVSPQGPIPPLAPVEVRYSDYTSYDQVPWYRKNWFAVVCFFVFWPALFVILVTGDVFYAKSGHVKKYTAMAKGALIALCVLAFFGILGSIIRSGSNSRSPSQQMAVSEEAQPAAPESPLQQLEAAQPANLLPTGKLAATFALGGNATDLQRQNTLAKIKGDVVQWRLPVYDVSKTDSGYEIQTQGRTDILGPGSGPVGTFSEITPLSDADRNVIDQLQTGDYVTIKGVISGATMRQLNLDPAIIITGSQEANVGNSSVGGTEKAVLSQGTPDAEGLATDSNVSNGAGSAAADAAASAIAQNGSQPQALAADTITPIQFAPGGTTASLRGTLFAKLQSDPIGAVMTAAANGNWQLVERETAAMAARAGPAPGNRSAAQQANSAGLALLSGGDARSAASTFQKAVILDPANVEARNNLAYALAKLGHRSQAVVQLMQVIHEAPDRSDAWGNLGQDLANTDVSSATAATSLAVYFSRNRSHTESWLRGIALSHAGTAWDKITSAVLTEMNQIPARDSTAADLTGASSTPPSTVENASIATNKPVRASAYAASAGVNNAQLATTVAPVATYDPPPQYPIQAVRNGEHGFVSVRLHIDVNGYVTSASIVSSSGHPLLDQSALQDVKSWLYKPAMKAGVPVPAQIVVPITFSLNGW